jgi:hypothetical protein
LEILATSLAMRLTPDELEWLSMALKERAGQRRREAGSEPPVHAGYRDAWEPARRNVAEGIRGISRVPGDLAKGPASS